MLFRSKCTDTHTHMQSHTCIHTYTYTKTHTYSHTLFLSHTHTHTHSPTSRDLLHEDLDVSVLGDRAQVLDYVPVLQVLVKSDLLMKGLRVPGEQGGGLHTHTHPYTHTVTHTHRHSHAFSRRRACYPPVARALACLCLLPAVSLWYLLDGDADLVAEVSPSIHHSIGPPPQDHPVPCLIRVILILQHTRTHPGTHTHIHKHTRAINK